VLAGIADNLNTIEIVNVPLAIERILRKNRFLVYYSYPALEDTNRTTIPFRRVQLADKGRFEDYLQTHLKGKGIPSMSAGLGRVFKQSIFEVFQNAVTHSKSRLGVFVCGQFYPNLQRVDLTIADAGVGIRTNVRNYLKRKVSSVAAIRWALEKGNTTKTGAQPGGVGLKFLRDFVLRNEGKIQIASRQGFYEFHDGQDDFIKIESDFPGTVVNLEINTGDTKSYRLVEEVWSSDIF
jgi:signal transduction histidine kinase